MCSFRERGGRGVAHYRISVSLSEEVLETLQQIADKHGVSVTEALRRSISAHKFLDDVKTSGNTVLLWNQATGKIQKVIE
ncbi:ribbon-helix-helix domain-containing protein [Sphaerisporangium dianthi]|uniref:Ribbon-helix-helix domain-containing protein n=1 Tax=Sphaerisporangium dianthi TaxID=1436120 RepID=A0ABV9CQJ6_9ACTN